MYQDLKQRYWCYGMKKDVAAHVALCDTCQRVKAEYQMLAGLLVRPLDVYVGLVGHFGHVWRTSWCMLDMYALVS
jgi:hypothetical protein